MMEGIEMLCSCILPTYKKQVCVSLCSSIRGYRFKSHGITLSESVLPNILANLDNEIVPELAR